MTFLYRLLATATVIALLSSCSDSDQGSLTDELDAALDRIEQQPRTRVGTSRGGLGNPDNDVNRRTNEHDRSTDDNNRITDDDHDDCSNSLKSQAGKTVCSATTGGAIAGLEFGTDIVEAVATLVDQCEGCPTSTRAGDGAAQWEVQNGTALKNQSAT